MAPTDTVLVLIASPGTALEPDLPATLGIAGDPRWLAEGEAMEIGIEAAAPGLEADLRRKLAGRPVDVAVVPAGNRRKRLLVADMDSTVIEQECIDELAAYSSRGDRIREITERAMRGEVEFVAALRERVAMLEGVEAGVIADILSNRIRLTGGGGTLTATMRAHGAYTALVSGGFRHFTEAIAGRVGFDHHEANGLVIEAGRLAGRLKEPILDSDAKVGALRRIAGDRGLAAADVIAVGDGANDVAMLKIAGLGVAFHAKPAVRAAAAARIDHGDLTALLYLQGYRKDEFVTS